MNDREMGWKYGLIKVAEPEFDCDETVCMLVELYWIHGGWNSYCQERLSSVKDLENALEDIKRDGVNEDFFNKGVFTWSDRDQDYEWKRNK